MLVLGREQDLAVRQRDVQVAVALAHDQRAPGVLLGGLHGAAEADAQGDLRHASHGRTGPSRSAASRVSAASMVVRFAYTMSVSSSSSAMRPLRPSAAPPPPSGAVDAVVHRTRPGRAARRRSRHEADQDGGRLHRLGDGETRGEMRLAQRVAQDRARVRDAQGRDARCHEFPVHRAEAGHTHIDVARPRSVEVEGRDVGDRSHVARVPSPAGRTCSWRRQAQVLVGLRDDGRLDGVQAHARQVALVLPRQVHQRRYRSAPEWGTNWSVAARVSRPPPARTGPVPVNRITWHSSSSSRASPAASSTES